MEFKTIFGEIISADCLGCSDRNVPALKKLQIAEMKNWRVEQDIELAYPAMIILVPKRHVSNYADLSSDELQELNELIVKSKNNIKKLFQVDRFVYMFWERPNGHFHFLIMPVFDFMNIKNRAGILSEITERNSDFTGDKEHMKLVAETIDKLRNLF